MSYDLLKKKRLLLLVVIGFVVWPFGLHAFFGAKFEPRDGTIYHGAQAEVRPKSIFAYNVDWKGLEKYVEASGQQPKLIMHFISFDSLAFRLLRRPILKISKQPYNYIPQIGLDFYSYPPGYHILNPNDITREIAEGNYDKKIKQLAQLFIKMETPVFLRPGYEFGGNGQGSHASRTYWIGAWRRIHDVFQQEGAQDVAFVWNTLDAQDFMDYYPGNNYVDWWAINVFSDYAEKDQFINFFIKEAEKHQKPVMIAESTPRYIGSVGGQVSWDMWYQSYFNLIFRYPHIKAFCYINASWKGYPDKTFAFDCRIQSDNFVTKKYREILSDPRFINAALK
jgi:hypothetical protein